MTVTSMHDPLPGQHASKMKGAVGLMTAAALAMGGLLAVSAPAKAAGDKAITAEVTEVPNERIEVAIEGTGFDDVSALPGQSAPGTYLMVIDKAADLADVTDTATSISAIIDEEGNFSDLLNVPVAELEEGSEYEVIAWPNRSFPTEANMFARTDIDIDWDVLLDRPAGDENGNEDEDTEPSISFTAKASQVTEKGLEIAISGSGFGEVQALPGQAGPGAYFTLIEQGSDLGEVSDTDTAISASIDDQGNVDAVLTVDVDSVDPEKDYEVISWPTRSNPSETNLYGRAALEINWDELDIPDNNDEDQDEDEETPEVNPEFTTSVTEVADERIDIAIAGKGFDAVEALPGQGVPLAYFTLIEKDSELSAVGQDATAVSAVIDENGELETVLSIDAEELDASKDYEVISWPSRAIPSEENLFARADVTIDWEALFPVPTPGDEDEDTDTSISFTAKASQVTEKGLEIAISGSGFGEVQALPGQAGPGAYFTLIEQGSDLGEVSDTDTAISASIDDHGNVDAVLTVDVDSVDPEKDYEVISWPTRSNPSEANLYGRADLEINWDELDIPDNNDEDQDEDENGNGGENGNDDEDEDETGNGNDDTDDNNDITVTVNDSSDASVRQGDEVTFSIAPVTAGTAFNVTVQSDPIELDTVTADESNSASTSWTVPEDFELGEHTVTFANDDLGSFAGTFTVIAADAPAGNDGDDTGNGTDTDTDSDGAVTTAGDQTGGTQSGLATTGASITMAAIIALLMVVFGAMIVAHNRKRAITETQNTSV